MIKAIIFDLGGVVIDFSNSRYYAHLSRTSGLSESTIRETIERRELPLLERGMINLTTFERSVARSLGISSKNVEWYKFYTRSVSIDVDVSELIETLHNEYIIAFISNIDKSRYKYTMKILDLDLFDFRFASCYIGLRKPGAGIFRHALKTMKISAGQAVFIDNQPENVMGARKIGIESVRFTSRRRLDIQLSGLGL